MKSPQKNYLTRSWQAAVALIVVLVAVSFVPPQSVGGVQLRRANILSDLVTFEDDAVATELAEESATLFDEEEFSVDMEAVQQQIVEVDTLPKRVETTFRWRVGWDDDVVLRRRAVPDTVLLSSRLTLVEEADTLVGPTFAAFCDTLLSARRTVRIAVLGDSFIEGDILTADLREELQRVYGGGGTGFAPVASPLTGFRRTVKTQSKGWTTHNIMQRRSAPESLRGNFYVSGWVSAPSTGASTRWEMTDYRARLDSCSRAEILFISPVASRIEVTLNDTLKHEFAVEGDAAVRRIVVEAPHVHALTMRVAEGTEGFIGYGARFESEGVIVDNYSIRSNNGQAMFWTNPSVNAQINDMVHYDLVILQYGLNLMQEGVRNYTSYGEQIEKMVAYVRECFPTAAVLVMGVSERSVRGDDGFTPMDAVPHMTRYQREAAQRAGAAFWPTSEAMNAEGGMDTFVKNGWAGKDFTHINYAGGRRIARALFDAINDRARRLDELRREIERRAEELRVLDSLQRVEIDSQLFPVNTALGGVNSDL